jgi:hypothetical protein
VPGSLERKALPQKNVLSHRAERRAKMALAFEGKYWHTSVVDRQGIEPYPRGFRDRRGTKRGPLRILNFPLRGAA